jgi:hypothetical protein
MRDAKFIFNVNDVVKVFLTEAGQTVFLRSSMRAYFPNYDASGVLELPLWQLMHIFGIAGTWGNLVYFVRNEIHYLGDVWGDRAKAVIAQAHKLEFERSG